MSNTHTLIYFVPTPKSFHLPLSLFFNYPNDCGTFGTIYFLHILVFTVFEIINIEPEIALE